MKRALHEWQEYDDLNDNGRVFGQNSKSRRVEKEASYTFSDEIITIKVVTEVKGEEVKLEWGCSLLINIKKY